MKRQFYHSPVGFWIIICLFCVLDFLNIRAVNDCLIGDKIWITICTSLTQTLVVDGAPLLLGDNIAYLKWKKGIKKPLHMVIFTILITIMAVFFILSFLQRITSADVFFSSGSSDLVFSVSTAIMSEDTFTPSTSQRITLIIIGLLPIGTSIISFFMSYSRNKVLALEDTMKLRREVLKKRTAIDILKARCDDSIDYQAAIDLGYNNMVKQVNIIGKEFITIFPRKVWAYQVSRTKSEISELQNKIGIYRSKCDELREVVASDLAAHDDARRYDAIRSEISAVEDTLNTLCNLKLVNSPDSCSFVTKELLSIDHDNTIKITKKSS